MPRKLSNLAYKLDDREHQQIFLERIFPEKFSWLRPVSNPVAYFVGAQPGSGKSRIQTQLRIMLESQNGIGSVMEIIGDDFRPYHPKYDELLRGPDVHAAFYTDLDSGKWVEFAIEASLAIRSHVVLEGTLRRPEVALATAATYQQAGFAVELHIPVTHEYQSRLYIMSRYLEQVQRKGYGRYTVRASHDVAYKALPRSVSTLAKADVFDRIVLYNFEMIPILETRSGDKDAPRKLQEILARQRSAPTILTHELLELIEYYLELALQYDKKECVRELLTLRANIGR